MSADYASLVFGTQALRRLVERDAELGGALGVAAELWEHQVAQVSAVLEDIHVRHVLGDEVGLGKTVQALAIIRALRLQRGYARAPDLRVVIVVPDELMQQWRDEALVRNNLELRVDQPDINGEGRPVLLWPDLLKRREDLWVLVETAELLVVDELAWLTKELQRDLTRAAATVPRVLFLTATPPLSDSPLSEAMLRAIEPWRASPTGQGTWSGLVGREQADWQELSAGEGTPSEREASLKASVSGSTRRIIRTRREDLGGRWPARRVKVHRFEPTPAERGRQRLLWEWMGVATDTTRDFNPVALAQRVRSPQSVRQRVTYLIGHGHDRGERLQELRELLGPEHGDSRWEALTDLLTGLWAAEPGAKVVIGANDNLTVDHLAESLPIAFDELGGHGRPLVVASIRNQRKGPDAIVDPDDVIATASHEFQRGQAQVMLITEEGVAGLNLQVARHVIFYACPWDIQEIDQLVGRVDRIVPGALSGRGQRVKPVTVHVLVQRGLVDDRVVTVLEAAQVLHSPAAGDREDVDALAAAVAVAGLSDGGEGWTKAREAAEVVAVARGSGATRLPLREHQPDRGAARRARVARLLEGSAAWPALGETTAQGWWAREDAVFAWLTLMKEAMLYSFNAIDPVSGAYTLRYRIGNSQYGPAERFAPMPISVMEQLHHTSRFWLRRHVRAVSGQIVDQRREVELLDHGGRLHDSLVEAWFAASVGRTLEFEHLVVAADSPLRPLRGSVLFLSVAALRAGACLPPISVDAPRIAAGLEADERFVLGQLRGEIVAAGVAMRAGATPAAIDRSQLDALLRPQADQQLRWTVEQAKIPKWATGERADEAQERVNVAIQAQVAAWWGAQQEALTAAIQGRLVVLDAEVHDLLVLEACRRTMDPALSPATMRAINELQARQRELGEEVLVRRAWLQAVRPPDTWPTIRAWVRVI
jgi:ATP-dependent helicase HepA